VFPAAIGTYTNLFVHTSKFCSLLAPKENRK